MGLPGNPAKRGGRVARPQRFRAKQPSCHSNHSCHSRDKKQPPYLRRRRKRLFFVYAAHFLRPLCCDLAHYRRSPRTALLLIYIIQSHTHPKRRKFCLKHAGQKSVKKELPERRKEPKRAVECWLKVQTHVWENPPRPPHNFISGCSAVGSAPALGAGCRRFESCHSDHLSSKNRLFRRFFCVKSSIFGARLTT